MYITGRDVFGTRSGQNGLFSFRRLVFFELIEEETPPNAASHEP